MGNCLASWVFVQVQFHGDPGFEPVGFVGFSLMNSKLTHCSLSLPWVISILDPQAVDFNIFWGVLLGCLLGLLLGDHGRCIIIRWLYHDSYTDMDCPELQASFIMSLSTYDELLVCFCIILLPSGLIVLGITSVDFGSRRAASSIVRLSVGIRFGELLGTLAIEVLLVADIGDLWLICLWVDVFGVLISVCSELLVQGLITPALLLLEFVEFFCAVCFSFIWEGFGALIPVCPFSLACMVCGLAGGVYLLVLGVDPSWCKQSFNSDNGIRIPRLFWSVLTLFSSESLDLIFSLREGTAVLGCLMVTSCLLSPQSVLTNMSWSHGFDVRVQYQLSIFCLWTSWLHVLSHGELQTDAWIAMALTVHAPQLQDSLVVCAFCLHFGLLWAYFSSGNSVCWLVDMDYNFDHLYSLLHLCNSCHFFMYLLDLLLCLLRGNVEIPSRNFPRPSLLWYKNNPFWGQHGLCMSFARVVFFMVSTKTKYPVDRVPKSWCFNENYKLECSRC